MEIDWSQALEVGSLGFLLVFIVLVALALVIWLAGLIIKRMGAADNENGGNNGNQTDKPAA